MKTRFLLTLISFSFLSLLLFGCGDNSGQSGHFSPDGGGGGDMNFEQQALKMEQDDLAKLHQGKNPYAQSDEDTKKGQDLARIHEGIETKKNPNEVIAKVNGENILRLELDRILDKAGKKMGKSRLHLVEERIIDDLVTQALLKQFIKKQNVHIDSNRIETEIQKFRENIKNNPDAKDKSLETLLEEQGGSLDELRVALDISFSIDEYLNQTIPDEEVKKYFDENKGNFNGETVTASHILIDTRGIEDDEEKLKAAKEKADKIKEELDNGADFAELAQRDSDCPSSKGGGQLGVVKRGEMVEEFTDAAFATEVGSYCGPVKTRFGYHIIKITDKKEGEDIKYEDVKDKVKVTLFNEKTINLIQELQDKAEIEILYKPTPYTADGGHGSMMMGHGGLPSAHGSVTMPGGHGDTSPHGGSSSPHGGMPPGHGGASPHGGSYQQGQMHPTEDESVEKNFTLTN